jgi:signal transduction histidine kinase
MAEESILQRSMTLAELIEAESFREVLTSFAELYRVGLKVFDAGGTKLVDIRVGNGPFCSYLFDHGPTRKACTELVSSLKNDSLADEKGDAKARAVSCFTGLRYVVLPISYEGDIMGRLIFGPFAPQGVSEPDEKLYQIEPSLDRQRSKELMSNVRQAPENVVASILGQLQRVVDVILFNSYRAVLTSQMHIESVTASYTELQEKAASLKEANDRLQELDKLKSNFLATVSHELRTPLTSVIGYSEMLLEGMAGDMNDEQREYVQTIMDKGESLLSLISQILDLSRIESGQLRLNLGEFDIGEILRASTTSVLPQAQKKNIDLRIEISDELPRYRGDKDKIGQVAVNLLGNAVKFTPENGVITLAADIWVGPRRDSDDDSGADALFALSEERFLRFYVEDSGVGIPPEKVEAVFERFFQVDNSSTREYGGTGLGLSIVKSFIEGHKGEVFAESEVSRGSKFTVLLPLDD